MLRRGASPTGSRWVGSLQRLARFEWRVLSCPRGPEQGARAQAGGRREADAGERKCGGSGLRAARRLRAQVHGTGPGPGDEQREIESSTRGCGEHAVPDRALGEPCGCATDLRPEGWGTAPPIRGRVFQAEGVAAAKPGRSQHGPGRHSQRSGGVSQARGRAEAAGAGVVALAPRGVLSRKPS